MNEQDMTLTCKIDLREMVKSLKGFTKSIESVRPIETAQIVDLFAEEVRFLRSTNTRLSAIFPLLMEKIGIPTESPLFQGGIQISQKEEEESDQPTYHNEFHVIEVLVAAFCLGRREHLPESRLGELLVAAAAHDLGHTGKTNSFPFELENQSFEIAQPILVNAGCNEDQLHRIWQMIVATDFRNGVYQVRSAYRETRALPPEDETRLLATQCLLLTEADVLFSCFDADYNDLLSKLLSAEWNRPENTLSPSEKMGFLSSVEFISDAAVQLGLEDRRKSLIDQLSKSPNEASS